MSLQRENKESGSFDNRESATTATEPQTPTVQCSSLVPRSEIPSLQSVLHFATGVAGSSSDGVGSASSGMLSGERREFLQSVLESFTEETEIIAHALNILKSSNGSNVLKDEDAVRTLNAIENVIDRFDMSTNFMKMDGFKIMVDYLQSTNENVLLGVLSIIGISSQNHVLCQNAAGAQDTLIGDILKILECPDWSHALRRKALFAISGLIQNNEENHSKFQTQDGYFFILKLFNIGDGPTKDRACFLIRMLCAQYSAFKPYMMDLGFMRTMIDYYMNLAPSESKIDVLNAMHAFLDEFPAGINDCYNNEGPFIIYLQDLMENPEELTDYEFEEIAALYTIFKDVETYESASRSEAAVNPANPVSDDSE